MIKQLIPQEFCLKCKGCCRFSAADSVWSPSLLEEEGRALAKNKTPPVLVSGTARLRLVQLPEGEGFACPFLIPQTNKCKVYRLRPLECQLYPFLLNRSENGRKIFLALDLHCPFIAQNRNDHQTEEYIAYLSGLFNTPRYVKMIRDNPRFIQNYPGVVNLRKLEF